MHRKQLLDLLESYTPFPEEPVDRLKAFIHANPTCFDRELSIGHITGSAWILNPTRTHALLTHHHILDCWLQLGGHADGDSDVLNVALREAQEESGLNSIKTLSNEIFDIDIHLFPSQKTLPAHYHHDIRFLFEADDTEPLTVSHESKDLCWVALEELETYTDKRSVLRLVEKTPAHTLGNAQ